VVNVVAATFFLWTTSVNFVYVVSLVTGSLLGAPLGAWLARRLSATLFRLVVVIIGLCVGAYLLLSAR
jgi:hypothetical protein